MVSPDRLAAEQRSQILLALPTRCGRARATRECQQLESADTPAGIDCRVKLYLAAQVEASKEVAVDLQRGTPAEQGFKDACLELILQNAARK